MRSVPVPLPFLANPLVAPWATELSSDPPIRSVTAAYQAEITDYTILADAAGGAVTVTLPIAHDAKNQVLNVKRVNAGAAVTVEGYGAETIDGAANVVLGAQWDKVSVQSNGAAWFVI